MSGVRVQGIAPHWPLKVVWKYFTDLCGPDGVSDVYYPVLNNDAIVIFRDDSVTAKILTTRHNKLNVLPLPNQVFSKQRVWLEKGLTALLQDNENYQEVLKTHAHVEVSMDKATKQMMLTGQTYQIEWAWRYLSNLQDQQETCMLRSTANHSVAADPALFNGSAVTNGVIPHTSLQDRPHISHSLHLTSPVTHNSARLQNGDVVSDSDVNISLPVGSTSGSGRRLPIPAIGREMRQSKVVDTRVTSLNIEFSQENGPGSFHCAGSEGSTGFIPTQNEGSMQSTVSAKPKVMPNKAITRDSVYDSHASLASEVVGDLEQRNQLMGLNSQAGRNFSTENGVSACASPPVNNYRTTQISSRSADALVQSSEGKSCGSACKSPELTDALAHSLDRNRGLTSPQGACRSALKKEAELRSSCQSSNRRSPAPYENIGDDCGAVGGMGYPSLRPEDLDSSEVESRGLNREQRVFSSLPYIPSNALKLPNNNLALLNRSIVELSRKHFEVGHRLKLKIYVEDITRTRTDAVVNAANWELKNIGGVAGALARAAGPEMEQDCKRIYLERGALRTAEVVKTKAYGKLKHVKYILHTVGPIFRKEDPGRCVFELAQTFLNCLQFSEKISMESVTFPFISTGIFGMPIEHCVTALFIALYKFSYERNNGTSTLEEVHFINNDMDSVCNAVLSAESAAKRENLDTAVKKMLEGEKLYGRCVYPFCDQKDMPKKKAYSSSTSSSTATATTTSSTITTTEECYGSWNSSTTSVGIISVAAAVAVESSSSRSQDSSHQRISRADLLKAGPQSISAIDVRPATPRPRSGSVDQGSRTVSTSCGIDSQSTSSTRGRDSSPMPTTRTRSNSVNSADRNNSTSSATSKPRGSSASSSSSSIQRAQPVIKPSLGPAVAPTTKKRSIGSAKSGRGGRTADQSIGNDTDVTSAAASETEEAPDMQCSICLDDPMNQPKKLPCGHQFCTPCADKALSITPRCPKCQRLFGIPTGTQPRHGTMTSTIDYTSHLPGYAACGTITITYNFPPGTQEACHPYPGRHYEGTHRVAYLPACPEGRDVLNMLQKAFDHRLVFTIGDSITTGMKGVITWNDIHHKTSTYGGPSQFGYPDPDYLYRVKEELAAKGITHP